MKCSTVLLLVVGAFGSDDFDSGNPVSKVVHLLEDLKSKIEKDEAQDNKDFEKHKCWCDKVKTDKTKDIADAKAEINRLESEPKDGKDATGTIPTARANIKSLENDLMLNGEDIEDQQKSIDESQFNRDKQHKKNMAEHKNNQEMMASLKQGAGIISGGAFHEEKKLVDYKSGESFVQLLSKRNHLRRSKHEPASKAISGILASQYETVATDEELMQRDEAAQASEFHKLSTNQLQQMAILQKTKADKTEEKVETEATMAEDIKLLLATKEQLKADEAFLQEATRDCDSATADKNTRDGLRQKELDGVTKAMEIIESKRELFASTFKKTPSFLQLSAKTMSAEAASQAAFSALKDKASLTHSLRLANVAAQVQEELPTGAFTEVLKKIEEVLGKIEEESKSDIAKKDHCTEEYHQNSKDHKKQVFLIQKSDTKIDKIQAHLDELAADKAQAEKEIADLVDDLAAAKTQRLKEHDDFKQAKADDELAIKTLGETRDALSKFYDENTGGAEVEASLAAEPMDDDDRAALLLKDDPTKMAESRKNLKNSEHKYTLSDKGGQKDTARGVLSMIDRVVENLQTEIKDDLEFEAKTQNEYDAAKKDMEASKAALDKKVADINSITSDEKGEKSSTEGEKDSDEKKQKSLETYKASIKEECDFILENFDDRVAKRQSERDGILRAKELLSGASFVQTEAKPVKEEVPQEAEEAPEQAEQAPELQEGSSLMNYLR